MAWYRTGTITTANGSTTITGAGTNWMNQRAGWMLCIPSTGAIHEIAEIISSTELRTAEPIAGAGAAGQAYFIVPTQGLALALSEKVGELITLFDNTRAAWEAVYQDFSATTYQLWLDQGNSGTVAEFLDTLVGEKGDTGATGASAYEAWLASGQTGTEADFLNWVSGNAIALAEAARDAALAAETGAAAAQGASEAARDASVLAQGASEAARDASAASASASDAAKTASETARDAAATSETNAATSATAGANAQAGAEAAQAASETARDDAQAHANAASLASNATKWAANGNYVEGQLLWSPADGITYRSLTNHSGSSVDPSQDAVNFVPATSGGALSKSQNLDDLPDKPLARTNMGLGSAATHNVPESGDAAPGEVVKGDDGRLTDPRAPTAHQHVKADITDLNDADYATAAQGTKADSAVQPSTLNDAEQRARNFSLWIGA